MDEFVSEQAFLSQKGAFGFVILLQTSEFEKSFFRPHNFGPDFAYVQYATSNLLRRPLLWIRKLIT